MELVQELNLPHLFEPLWPHLEWSQSCQVLTTLPYRTKPYSVHHTVKDGFGDLLHVSRPLSHPPLAMYQDASHH